VLCTGINLRIGEYDDLHAEKKEIDFIPGMLILLKREVIERVGLLDETYFLYFEDIDYSLRIKKLYKMIYTSASTVYHRSGGGIKGRMYTETYLYYYTRNRFWFFREMHSGYMFYVLILSFLSCMQKSLIVLAEKSDDRKRKLFSLWKGFFAGASGRRVPKRLSRNCTVAWFAFLSHFILMTCRSSGAEMNYSGNGQVDSRERHLISEFETHRDSNSCSVHPCGVACEY